VTFRTATTNYRHRHHQQERLCGNTDPTALPAGLPDSISAQVSGPDSNYNAVTGAAILDTR